MGELGAVEQQNQSQLRYPGHHNLDLGHLVSKVFWHVSPRAGPVVGSGHAGEMTSLSWPKNACLHLDELEEVAGRARSLLLHTMAPDVDGWWWMVSCLS